MIAWIIGVWLALDGLILFAASRIFRKNQESQDSAYLDQVFADMEGEQFEREYRQFLVDSGLPGA